MMDFVPQHFDTKRLHVRAVHAGDAGALLTLFNANAHIGVWDPTFEPIALPEMEAHVRRSLTWAEQGQRPFQMQCFERLDNGRMVGYYHSHYGLPHADSIFISLFAMAPEAQHSGYGSEVLDMLSVWWAALRDMRRACAEVYLKNWPALRFWTAAGFTHIAEWRGDSVLTAEGHASFILEKRWRGSPDAAKRLV